MSDFLSEDDALRDSSRHQRLLTGQNRILEMIASGVRLSEVLNNLILFMEKESGRVMGSVLILSPDGKSLHTGAGPHLPEEYTKLVNGLIPGPYNGSCGSAVHNREIIIVEDTSNDPHWAKYKEVAEHFGLKACTSIPIYGSNQQILGTFAFYYRTPTAPDAYELELIQVSSALAGIAIERHNTEKVLKENEELYRLITENINDLIAVLDLNGNYIYTSPSYYTGQGFNPMELKETSFFSLIHPEDLNEFRALHENVLNGQEVSTVFRSKDARGNWRWMEGWAKQIVHRGEKCILAVGRDITLQREAEEALRLSEEKFRTTFESATVGMALIAIDGHLMTANKAWCDFIGYTEAELQTMHIGTFMHPDSLTESLDNLKMMLLGQKKSWSKEKTYIHKTGKIMWGYLSTTLMRGSRNEPLYFISSLQDITERKVAEENQRLLTEDLRKQNEDLYQFSYITSHNLRGPIASILGIVNLLDTESIDENTRVLLEHLKKSAENLDTVVTDLNNINAYRQAIWEARQIVSFSELIEDVTNILNVQIYAAQAEVVSDVSSAPSVFSVNSYAHNILLNLLDNAIRFRAPERKLMIKIETRVEENYIRLSIADNGLGIDLKKQGDKVFGLYKRFHAHVEGKGLGLYLVKTQIESLGGKIEVESQVDVGSTFHVYFRKN